MRKRKTFKISDLKNEVNRRNSGSIDWEGFVPGTILIMLCLGVASVIVFYMMGFEAALEAGVR